MATQNPKSTWMISSSSTVAPMIRHDGILDAADVYRCASVWVPAANLYVNASPERGRP
jgi:hypothetical protein